MTVQNTGNRKTYTGDGVSTVFAFPYKIIDTTDIKAFVGGLSTTSFTVSTPTDNGVNVTFSVAPANGLSIVLLRDPDLLQQSSLPSTGPFPSKTVEKMVDKLTLQVQRIRELIGRSLTLADGDTSTASLVLPTPSATKFIGWNVDGTGLQNVDPQTLATTISATSWKLDKFTGDGTTTAFTLSVAPGSTYALMVSIGGVVQEPGADFSVSVKTVTFTTAPPAGLKILCQYGQSVQTIGTADAGNMVGVVPIVNGGTGATSAAAARAALGVDTFVSNLFALRATRSTSQTSGAEVLFDTELRDTLSWFNPGTSTITVTSACWALVHVKLRLVNNTASTTAFTVQLVSGATVVAKKDVAVAVTTGGSDVDIIFFGPISAGALRVTTASAFSVGSISLDGSSNPASISVVAFP